MARRNDKRRDLKLESLEGRQLMTSGVAPTALDQYTLELVNLVRTKPAEAAVRLQSKITESSRDALEYFRVDIGRATRQIAESPTRQPLAWNKDLAAAAEDHSRDMAVKGFQSHTGTDGSTPDQRMERRGYQSRVRATENAFAYADSVDNAVQAFAYDWGVANQAHLRNMTDAGVPDDQTSNEFGSAAVDSKLFGFGKVVTHLMGRRQDAPIYLLGVAYDDNDGDRFYTPGEGRGGVEVDVTDSAGRTQTTRSGEAGGYQIALAPGIYRIRARVGNTEVRNQEVTISRQNVKLDFVLTDSWTQTPVDSTPPQPQHIKPPADVPTVETKPVTPTKVIKVETKPVTPTKVVKVETEPVTPTKAQPIADPVSFALDEAIDFDQFWQSVPHA